MKIIALGDSITYGDTGNHQEPSPVRWTDLLAEATQHTVVNRGVNADTTRLALERFPADVQESGADIVLIQFGYNDCNRWDTDNGLPRVSLKAFTANLEEMIARAEAFDIDPIILPMHACQKGPEYATWQLPYMLALDGYATSVAPVGLELTDGLHLTDRDNGRYARWIQEVIFW